MERLRGVEKWPDFPTIVVMVVVVAAVVAWPVERSGATPKIEVVLQNESPPSVALLLLHSPFFLIAANAPKKSVEISKKYVINFLRHEKML